MAKAWNADLPITAVDEDARTFTAEVTDANLILMQQPWIVDRITVTYHLADDTPTTVQAGDVLKLVSRVAGS